MTAIDVRDHPAVQQARLERRQAAYMKIGHLLWCPTDIYEKDPSTIFACAEWWNTGRPFAWSPTQPSSSFANPAYEWRNPTFACFMSVWERLDELAPSAFRR